jgi:hypothetical protein
MNRPLWPGNNGLLSNHRYIDDSLWMKIRNEALMEFVDVTEGWPQADQRDLRKHESWRKKFCPRSFCVVVVVLREGCGIKREFIVVIL